LCLEPHLTGAKAKVAQGAIIERRDLAAAARATAPLAQEFPDKMKGHRATKAALPESLYPADDGHLEKKKPAVDREAEDRPPASVRRG
jgi:hypothetical protein